MRCLLPTLVGNHSLFVKCVYPDAKEPSKRIQTSALTRHLETHHNITLVDGKGEEWGNVFKQYEELHKDRATEKGKQWARDVLARVSRLSPSDNGKKRQGTLLDTGFMTDSPSPPRAAGGTTG